MCFASPVFVFFSTPARLVSLLGLVDQILGDEASQAYGWVDVTAHGEVRVAPVRSHGVRGIVPDLL